VIERKDLPWLQGKTLLLEGDSVDRNNADYFCEFASAMVHDIPIDNLLVTTSNGSHYIAPTQYMKICRVDEYDFELIIFSHFGLEEADIWGYEKPTLVDERISLLKPMFESHGRKPDMILLSSGYSPF